MKSTLEEANCTIQKSCSDMMRYYNQQYIPNPVFKSSNKVFLNLLYIYTISPSSKLLYCYLGPYVMEKQVGLMLYHLKLFFILQILYIVFHVVKLSITFEDPISEQYLCFQLDLIIINREEEWKVEKNLRQSLVLWKMPIYDQVEGFQPGIQLLGECFRGFCTRNSSRISLP